MTEKITITGMSCHHCVAAVREALNNVSGVEADAVEIGSAVVRIDEDRVQPSELDRAIRMAGYEPVSHERVEP